MNWLANPATPNYLVLAVVTITVGIGYFRYAKVQGANATITLLNAQINAQKLVIESQKVDLAQAQGDNRALVAKLEGQLAHMQIVENLVRGIPAWAELSANYNTLQAHYVELEKTIKALDPVIAVFQKHVDEQQEMHSWLAQWKERNP